MEIEMRSIDELKPFAKNPKKHPEKQIEMLKKSMGEFGFTNPILVSRDDMIIAGHGRLEAAKSIGLTEVPTINIDLPYEKAVAYVVADNRLAELAEDDSAMLAELLNDIDCELLDAVGYSQDDLDDLMDEIEALTPSEVVEDEAPEVSQGEPITERGDIWTLGKHRLMCGDSTDTADVSKLMDGIKADMVFTDPPYGIAYSSSKFDGNKAGVTNIRNKAEMIKGDSADFDPSFILDICKGIKEIFIWGFQYYPDSLKRGGIIVWNKKQESETECPHGDFELCWSKQERNKMCWLRWGGFNNKECGEDRLHTTQKPIALVTWFFDNWGSGKSSVLDLFGGSGSTMMACEQTGRINYSMELDEKYCDVIIQRYVNLTGDDELTLNGEPYTWAGSGE